MLSDVWAYYAACFGIAIRLSTRLASAFATLAIAALYLLLLFLGYTVSFADGPVGTFFSGVVGVALAWLAIFLFSFLFIAPLVRDRERGERIKALEKDADLIAAQREHTAAVREHTGEIRSQRSSAEKYRGGVDNQPNCSLFIVNDWGKHRYWCLEIHNDGADAEYIVMMDFAEAKISMKPPTPVHAEWATSPGDKSRFILQGARDRVFLHGVEVSDLFFMDEFRWVSYHGRRTGRGNAWSPASEPKTFPQIHYLKIIVSAKPPLVGGSKVIVIEIEGFELRVISGEVQMLQ